MPGKDEFEIDPVKQYSNLSDIYEDNHYNESERMVAARGMQFGEAADLYGDIETVDHYGYVTRGYVGRKKVG